MRVLLRAGFDRFTGYGCDAIDLAVALEKQGADVIPMPTHIVGGLPRPFTRLLEKDPTRLAPDVLLMFASARQVHEADVAAFAPKVVGYTWDQPGWKTKTDDAWVTSAAVVAEQAQVMPLGVDGDAWPLVRRDQQGQMTFLTVGQPTQPLLQVWADLKDVHPEFDARLEWCDGHEDGDALVRRYLRADVMIAVGTGEWKDRRCREFMATGGTMIATAEGDRGQWLHPDVVYPVAEMGDVKNAVWWAYSHRREVARKGERASSWIRSTQDWSVVTKRMVKRLWTLQ